jgi:23S rRNA (pseudouridine1915-N3)-methyltransferase
MLRIDIIAVGKIKEKFLREAISEYRKRLSKFCKLNIIEIKDEPDGNSFSDKEIEILKEKEAIKISWKINPGSKVITLEIDGEMISSPDLAKKIENFMIRGNSYLTFIIGGSNGLHDSISKKADLKLSLSKMTFTHQMTRLILLEQIYRAFKINNNETYHK